MTATEGESSLMSNHTIYLPTTNTYSFNHSLWMTTVEGHFGYNVPIITPTKFSLVIAFPGSTF